MQLVAVYVVCAVLSVVSSFLAIKLIKCKRSRQREQADRKDEESRQRLALQSSQMALDREFTTRGLLQAMFNAVPEGQLVFSADESFTPQAFTHSNAAIGQLLDYAPADLLKLTPMDLELVREPDVQRTQTDVDLMRLDNTEQLPRNSVMALRSMQRNIRNAVADGVLTYESSLVARRHHRIPVEVSLTALAKTAPFRLLYSVRRIEERQRLMTSLNEAERRFKDFFNTTLVGAALYDAEQRLIAVNPACLRIFGCPHKDDFAKLDFFSCGFISNDVHQQVAKGESTNGESVFDLDAMISSMGFVSNRRGKAVLDVFFQNLGYDSVRHPIGHLIQVQDLTDLRETESALQLREAQLRQSHKMQAIGTMTGGIAHDFNNILTPILGYAEIGLEVCDKNDRMYDFIKEIRSASLRAKELVHQILIFSRQSDNATSPIHLGPIVKEVAKQQATACPANITVRYAIRTDRDLAQANPTQIHQILTNLVTNAIYAMAEKEGAVDIQLTCFSMGWRHRQEFPQLKKGTYLRLTVSDTGCGIPEDLRQQIFSPFFSTKPSGEGTGMGLAVTGNIVDSLGGAIALESKVGEGSTFHVALPLIDAEPDDTPEEWHPPLAKGQRVLFVDDDVSIAKMAEPMLASLGYTPVVCTSGSIAIDRFKGDPASFALLITDLVMPGMTGADLASAIREIRPELPVILCSGFSEQLSEEATRQVGFSAFLQKPVTRHHLSETIAGVLGT